MLRSFGNCFNGRVLDVLEETELEKSLVYRDELDKKHPQKAAVEGDRPSYPLNQTEGYRKEKKEVVRVKIRMTKQEAEKLLSRCRTGGALDFRHVAAQIASVPPEHVNVMMHHDAKATLTSIPEEA